MAEPTRPGRTDETSVVVYHGEEDVEGEPIEPEQQAAEVVQPMKTLVTIGGRAMAQDVALSSLPEQVQQAARQQQGHIVHETTAGELATSTLHRCMHCRFFDQAGWTGILKAAQASGDKMKLHELNGIRGMIAENMDVNLRDSHDLDKAGDLDLEHALNSLGVCRALTEHMHEEIIVHPTSSCPDDQPFFFKPRGGLAAAKAATSGYDWIMRRAQGRRE